MVDGVRRIKLGSHGMEVSALGLGCMSLTNSGYGPGKPEEDMIKLIHHAVNSGVTHLDTSDLYGPHLNEILIGKALKGLDRRSVQLATKFGIKSLEGDCDIGGDPEFVRACCEASLKRLDVDYIDLYYVHRNDSRVPIEITVNHVMLGCMQPRLQYNGCEFEQIHVIAQKKRCTTSQLALAWVLHQGTDLSPIPGTSKIENFNQNIGALSVKLSPEDMAELESIASVDAFKGDGLPPTILALSNVETMPLSSWK